MSDNATKKEVTLPSEANDVDRFDRFLAYQLKELEIKAATLEFEKQKDNNGFQFGQAALQVQATDRQHQREMAVSVKKSFYKLVLGMACVFALIVGAALFLGRDSVAMEIIKAVAYVVTGLFGGYGLGRTRSVENGGGNKDLPK